LARTRELDYMKDLKLKPDDKGALVPDYADMWAQINDPERTLLGVDQRRFIEKVLAESVDNDVAWQVIGSQVVMGRTKGPDLTKVMSKEVLALMLSTLPLSIKSTLMAMLGLYEEKNGFPLNLDAWDGYAAERERLFDIFKSTKSRPIVISGDSHTAWANNLTDNKGTHVGVEIGVTSITSPTTYLDTILPGFNLAATLAAQNQDIIACDDQHNGFVILTLTRDEAEAQWMQVSTILNSEFETSTRARFKAVMENKTISHLKVI
jgi:alkaline phosphatase D